MKFLSLALVDYHKRQFEKDYVETRYKELKKRYTTTTQLSEAEIEKLLEIEQ